MLTGLMREAVRKVVPVQRLSGLCVAQMGEALIRGFIQSGVSSAANLSASVRSEERQRAMQQLGIQARCHLGCFLL